MMRATMMLLALVCACTTNHVAPPPTGPWDVPTGWKREVIPFPLEFAPAIAHTGVEELRFPPGFLKAGAPNHWSYVFAWRTRDAAALDAHALGDELAAYFRGLLVAVDGDKHRITGEQITATAAPTAHGFALAAHVLDTFNDDAAAFELTGSAARIACPDGGALWTFVLATATVPADTRKTLDALAASATCSSVPLDHH